ncbi:MAG TPA: PAS domain S-box protein [Azospirillum sp.]|nr:PAS domain S-box protein [Azospirillum sp.]
MPRAWTTWIGDRLERRIAVQFVLTVLVTSVLFAALALAGNAFLLRQEQAKDMRRHMSLAADRLAGKVSVLARGTVDLAGNPLMATALLDSRGRDAYLRPFLSNHRLPLSEAHGLTLCDFNGRPLANRQAAAPACFRDDPLADALFRTERPQWGIRTVEGRAHALILQPVLYPGTGHAEGYAAATLDLAGALADAAGRDGDAVLRLLDGDGTPLAAVGDLGDARVVWQTVPVTLAGLGALQLSRAERMAPPEGLPFLSGVYAGGVAVALVIALVLARRMANGLAAPLEALSRTAARIAAEGAGSRPADVVGRDEVAQLAQSFNRMLAALRQSQEGLEHQVSERTRALEAALSAVESSERRYRALFSGARVAMLLVDPADGAIVDANESATAYYGYPADRLRTMTIGAIDTLTADEVAREMETARRQGRSHLHFRHRLAGGEVRDVEVHSGPIDLDGRTLLYSIVHDVTDRRRLEAERRHLTRQLQDVLSAASEVAVVAIDRANGLITLFNTGAQRMLGYAGEEVVGRCTPLLFHDLGEALERARQLGLPAQTPDDALRALVEVAGREGRERREWTYVHKDGSRIAVSLAVTPVRSDDGEITGYLGVAQDVTERRTAEAALKDSEERFRSLVESTTDWVWETDDQHRFRWFSPSLDAILGTSSDALIGKRREDLAADGHEIESEVWQRHFADLRAHRPFRDLRYWLRAADGTARWISISGSPRFDADGRFLGYRGSGSDVTERAATSMRLRMLAQVVEHSPVSVVITDPQGVIEYANARLLQVTGWARDELLGRHCRLFASGETPPDTYRQLWETIAGGGTWIGELKNRRRDGALYWESVAISPIRDDEGRIVRYVGIKEDVTYRKEAEERIAAANARLNEQARQLQRSNAELEQFAYVASHDLRQPLRAVTNYLTLIERSLGDTMDEEIREFMGFAIGGARRMDALIRDLLEYSRIGRKERPFEPVPLAAAVADCLLDLEVAIGEAEARVTVAEGLPTVRGDRVELTRLFQNLIGNAVKYRAPGREPVVEVGWRAEGDEWLVWVRDNGIGIAPEDFERAFGVFQRLVTRERYEGTGIGLAVCKKIVEHHGGRIWITSEPGEGSVFHVALPRLNPPAR